MAVGFDTSRTNALVDLVIIAYFTRFNSRSAAKAGFKWSYQGENRFLRFGKYV